VLIAIALLVPFAVPAAASTASAWRLVDLGAGDGSVAFAVNDHRHVVGQYLNSRSFLWRHGRVTDLGIDGVSLALDVNNRDEVVGYRLGAQDARAFLWRHGTIVDIGTLPGGNVSYAQAINDRGEVVGWSEARDGRLHAFRWRNGVMKDLGRSGVGSLAYDINNAGQIAGETFGETGTLPTAVRWWRGTVTALHGGAVSATAISHSGAITGYSAGGDGSNPGFVWRRGAYVEIPRPPGGGMAFLQPTGINNRLQVVGISSSGAFVWQRGKTTILPALTIGSVANDINDRGVIVGSNPTTTEGTNPHAVLWVR
jgi:probable HAF family extracellular repeat protein